MSVCISVHSRFYAFASLFGYPSAPCFRHVLADPVGVDNVRRHSNQYHFRGTETSYSNTARGAQREEARQSSSNSNSSEHEIIVDMRDAQVANRQIISDDEGEYVDFVEEK